MSFNCSKTPPTQRRHMNFPMDRSSALEMNAFRVQKYYFSLLYLVSCVGGRMVVSERANDVYTTSPQRRCNDVASTLRRRYINVIGLL